MSWSGVTWLTHWYCKKHHNGKIPCGKCKRLHKTLRIREQFQHPPVCMRLVMRCARQVRMMASPWPVEDTAPTWLSAYPPAPGDQQKTQVRLGWSAPKWAHRREMRGGGCNNKKSFVGTHPLYIFFFFLKTKNVFTEFYPLTQWPQCWKLG